MEKFPYLFLFLILFTLICHAVKLGDNEEAKSSPGADQSSPPVDQTMPDMPVFISQCNETYNIEMSYLDSLNSSGSFPDETHETPKCYMDCLLAKIGVLTAEGAFNPARAAVIFGGSRGGKVMEDVEDMADDCANMMKEEPSDCERAYGFLKCLMQMQIQKYETNDQSENQGKIDYSKK